MKTQVDKPSCLADLVFEGKFALLPGLIPPFHTWAIIMNIHIATGEGQTEHEESDLRRLWQQGDIPKDAKYWKQGMKDWQPLAGYFLPQDAPFNPYASTPDLTPQRASEGAYSYVKSPHLLTRFLLVMLWGGIICHVISMWSNFTQISLLSGTFTNEEGLANDSRQATIAMVGVTVYLITSIPFLMWIYRANLNCRGFGANEMKFTPGWSVGYFFIPFVNLVRPYQAMKQIWQASHDPMNWQLQPVSPILGWWWALWILSNIMGHLTNSFAQRADTIDNLINSTRISIASDVTGVALSLVAIAMVRKIFQKQEELVNHLPGPEPQES